MYRWTVIPLILALGLQSGQAAAGQSPTQNACAFTVPAGWNQIATRWDGECREGHAEGLGVLKEYRHREVVRLFFGRLVQGELKLGVIDQAEGYVAAEFANGKPLSSGDRQRTVDAFAEAEKAANEAATRFSKAGQQASAKFYAAKARQLREQLD